MASSLPPSPVSSGTSAKSPSPGPSSSVAGRPKQSAVWDYFSYESAQDKSVCEVIVEGSSQDSAMTPCGHALHGKFTSNLKQHLRKHHPKEYDEMMQKEKERERLKLEKGKYKKAATPFSTPPGSGQMTITQSFPKVYDKGTSRYRQITRKLAIFVGCTNVPNRIVESPEFRELLQAADPRYPVPGRTALNKELDLVMKELKGKIASCLSDARKVNICTDVWTKKGMTSSYLGVTAHFFSQRDHRRRNVTIAVRRIPSPHTGEHIREIIDEVLAEWELPTNKIGAILTDNGSNMLKAFRIQCEDLQAQDENNTEEKFNLDESDESGDESSDESGDDGEEVDSMCADFEERERDHELAFSNYKRVSCFAHTLQLVVQKFHTVKSFKKVLSSAYKLVKKVNKSVKATEMLIGMCGKKLVSNCPTRWSSTYLLIERLLEVRTSLTAMLEQMEWDNLAASEWKVLEGIRDVLQPFAQYTALIGGEYYTTVSAVIPVIMEINLHLQETAKQPLLIGASKILQSELQRRFRKFTDPNDSDHEPLFLMATALDPRYRVLLTASQQHSAKVHLLKQVKEGELNSSSSSASGSPSVSHITFDEQCEEPPLKRFRLLSSILQEKQKDSTKKVHSTPPGQEELERYLSTTHIVTDRVDPITFWTECEHMYPTLAAIATDILAIPASSTPVERVFSTAGEATAGKRNRLSQSNLEREILMRKNVDFLG